MLALIPLLRANYYYIDDTGRALEGYAGWGDYSRYLSVLLSKFIHASNYLTDVSPITQFMAIALLVGASIILVRVVRGSGTVSAWDLVAVVPLGLSPYFLECLSYKYDSPYMALSVFFSVAPLAFRKKSELSCGFITVLCMIGVCTTYQASTGIFPMAVLLIALLEWLQGKSFKEALRFVLVSAVAYIAGILIFKFFIMHPSDSRQYASYSATASLGAIIENYKTYFALLQSDLKASWKLISFVLMGWFVISATVASKQNRLASFVLSVLTLAVMALLAFGVYPALMPLSINPRAMYGVGAFIALVALGGIREGAGRWFTRMFVIALAWSFITFAASYGNALALQQDWVDFRMEEVLNDLTDLDEFKNDETQSVQIEGTAGYAAPVANMAEKFSMLKRLIPITFGENWYWSRAKFARYYGLKCSFDEGTFVDSYDDYTFLQESSYHRIYEKDGHFVIELK